MRPPPSSEFMYPSSSSSPVFPEGMPQAICDSIYQNAHNSAMCAYQQEFARNFEHMVEQWSQPQRIETPSSSSSSPSRTLLARETNHQLNSTLPVIDELDHVNAPRYPLERRYCYICASNPCTCNPRKSGNQPAFSSSAVPLEPTEGQAPFYPNSKEFYTSSNGIVSPGFTIKESQFKVMIKSQFYGQNLKSGQQSLQKSQGKFKIIVKCEEEKHDTLDVHICVERKTSNGWERVNRNSELHFDFSSHNTIQLDELLDFTEEFNNK